MSVLFAAACLMAAATHALQAGNAGSVERSTLSSRSPVYTASQAVAGKSVYDEQCASCHQSSLQGAREAPPLAGSAFASRWGGRSVLELFTQIRAAMPPGAPGSLTPEQTAELLAYIFQTNTWLASQEPLRADAAGMRAMVLPAQSQPFAQLQPGVTMPPPPVPLANPLASISPVSESMLADPPPGDWLTWRRTADAMGYSPLDQINRENVNRLSHVWAWSLPNGANETTPLVHDGVLFAFGLGDVVQALNAATGDLLWEYSDRTLTTDTARMFGQGPLKKAMAIHGHRLFVATSDNHMLALDVRTGGVIWDAPVEPSASMVTGGPLYAAGNIIVGTGAAFGNGSYRGGFIVALDAETGKRQWEFRTIPGPGEPGGDSWNDLPAAARSGGSVWTPGSYDRELGLVFFGVAQTYDTAPLREPVANSNSTNDALYTDTTLALDPGTGRLVWHFQHQANDQWDLDWAFERQILTLPVDGKPRKVVVTAGKDAIHDVLDARTGKYLFSIDPGLQNVVTSIDARSGRKQIDPAKVPGDGKLKFVCPHVGGAKNWIPSAFNPASHVLFVPLVESCMYMTPLAPGEIGPLTTNVRIGLAPREGSDGLFGRLQAIDLRTRKTVWTQRQRAPSTSGTLVTKGGLVFAGSLDRVLAAYDDTTGEKLWSRRLDEVINSAPIAFAVDGRQFVAVVVGLGGMYSKLYMPLVPEIKYPVNRSSTLWVFALPDPDPDGGR